uniref:Integrase_H2C2 domain-containing protein n=1 Tax=Heterorhabditis bacteriophora TaxID=37862 RepID=A0A1I7WST0_HETBA
MKRIQLIIDKYHIGGHVVRMVTMGIADQLKEIKMSEDKAEDILEQCQECDAFVNTNPAMCDILPFSLFHKKMENVQKFDKEKPAMLSKGPNKYEF